MVDAQQWLDKEYPIEKRNTTTYLSISYEKLTGELALVDWVNLEEIRLNNNQITSLKIINCPQLKEIWACWNHLTKVEGLPVSLIRLNLCDNQLSSDLGMFSQLINLEWLLIGNLDEDEIKQGIYNNWTGSLQPLQNLTKLKWLGISGTDLNAGVEYLPSSLETLYYNTDDRPNCQLTKIVDKLKLFDEMEKTAREEWKREQQSKSIQYTSQIEWIKK